MLALARPSVLRASRGAASRSLVTKAERWTPQQIRAIDAAGLPSVDLASTLPNIEARWAALDKEHQYAVFRQLEELQRKDWKELSTDQKKAAYFVSFGPHGPRKPHVQPGQGMRTFFGTVGLIGVTAAVFFGIRSQAPAPPKTMTKEWQEQSNERAREEKLNPITGISSEGYKGEGMVQ
ncbi:putative cytochrome-c oxidase chain V precursor [Tilletiopsis washingtonensis]|uniref:Putative cytochrome-c oxidase chain V n=1 Tax=Tilletiopsis washingtonensis TaxID=58919 RepID=A0A316Z610_9BASI|nr:putative cytochrome-c oxidase chain V precursor [Tilletiopsis washingtonensis]PWN96398.1 putative cytochrome-c oxidase chain V precursor [Tilletiopsis washingtonensis]